MKKITTKLYAILAAAIVFGNLMIPGMNFQSFAANQDLHSDYVSESSNSEEEEEDKEEKEEESFPVQADASIDGSSVIVTAQKDSFQTDDGYYYLLEQEIWENGTEGTKIEKKHTSRKTMKFEIPFDEEEADRIVYKKFTICGYVDGEWIQISNTAYISNPEDLSDQAVERKDDGFKGILPDSQMIVSSLDSIDEIGATEISYNMPAAQFFGTGYDYEFQGETYHFNMAVVGGYDELVKRAEKAGIQINMIILCDPALSGKDPSMIHPLSRGLSSNYLMFNTADEGAKDVEAFANFLGERYPEIDNWIIGNEVNAQDLWNGFSSMDLETFTKAYADEFRIFYNAIKSHNANAHVYIATDQEWKSDNEAVHFGVKDFIDEFNDQIREGGNIDWGLSNHPYNFPLYEPNVANLKDKPQVTHDIDSSKYVTMENIEILTDYMEGDELLSPDGEVRDILLSEVGYTSSSAMGSNESLQAADIVYALNRASTNQYIEGIVINRQKSDISEILQGLDYGLINTDGSKKLAWKWYQNYNDPDVIRESSDILGIDIKEDCEQYGR